MKTTVVDETTHTVPPLTHESAHTEAAVQVQALGPQAMVVAMRARHRYKWIAFGVATVLVIVLFLALDKSVLVSSTDIVRGPHTGFHQDSMYQDNDDNMNRNNNHTIGGGSPMKVLISAGCTGSTQTGKMVRAILLAHGHHLYSVRDHELLKPFKNPLYEVAKHDLMMKRQSNEEPTYAGIIVMSGLQRIGANFAYLHRWNKLDLCVCAVKDCFDPQPGYPVFAGNGTRTSMCFQRRKRPATKIQTYFFPTMTTRCTRKGRRKEQQNQQRLVDLLGVTPTTVSYEELYAYSFTADPATFDQSVGSWMALLKALLVEHDVDEDIVREVLRPQQNTRSIALHKQVIYNIEEVVEELRHSTDPLDLTYLRL